VAPPARAADVEVGHHTHVQVTVPKPGTIVNGVVNVPATLILHDQVGNPNFIRWQDGSTDKGRITVSKSQFTCVTTDFTDCKLSLNLPINFSNFGTGLRELRISLNIPDEDPDLTGSQRMYQSFGIPVCVRACSPIAISGRSLNFIEGRGWYQGHGYQNARITTGIDSVKHGGTVGVKLAPGSGGLPTKWTAIYVNPNMHAGLPGITLRPPTPGSFSGKVVLPAGEGVSKLVSIASDGQNSGVLAVTYGGPASSTMTVESQAWWSKSGFVMP
jgi:hypothetical protein